MTHHTYKAKDAEIRVFPKEEPGDRSDMYVIDVLGATVSLRLVPDDPDDENGPGGTLKIMIDADGVFIVGVNDDENVYG